MYEKAKENLVGDDKGAVVNSDDEIVSDLLNMGITQEDINRGKVYKLTTQNLEKMGINNVQSNNDEGWYVIVYNIEDTSAEIYYTNGYQGKYSLTDIEKIEI